MPRSLWSYRPRLGVLQSALIQASLQILEFNLSFVSSFPFEQIERSFASCQAYPGSSRSRRLGSRNRFAFQQQIQTDQGHKKDSESFCDR